MLVRVRVYMSSMRARARPSVCTARCHGGGGRRRSVGRVAVVPAAAGDSRERACACVSVFSRCARVSCVIVFGEDQRRRSRVVFAVAAFASSSFGDETECLGKEKHVHE